MIRLKPEDFADTQQLATLAATVKLSSEDFQKRFGYLVGVK
jgi:hypothetical protein